LLQRREEQIKVQANRVAELENMISLRTSAVPMLMNEPFMPNVDLDAEADEALEAARSMPCGPEKIEALKKAGLWSTPSTTRSALLERIS
jgi:hypothetical protein